MSTVNRAWTMLDSRLVTRAIQIVAILSLFLAIGVGVRQYSLADCLARYSDDNARSSTQRIAAAEQDRQALDEMIGGIAAARSAASPQEAQRMVSGAFDKYLVARAEADRQRAENPPPAPPSERCS